MKRWFVMTPLAFVMASCVLNAALGQESVQSSIVAFERSNELPKESLPIERYARFYKVILISSVNKSELPISIVQFKYIQRNMKPGMYIMTDPKEIPKDPMTDGGCLVIDGFFRLSDGKLLGMECDPQR